MDKCQSRDGAQNALQDIEKFLESCTLGFDPQSLKHNYETILTDELQVSCVVFFIIHNNFLLLFVSKID